MSARQTDLLEVKWACLDTEMVLAIDHPLDQLHPVVVQLIGYLLDLLALELESRILRLLLYLSFVNQFLEVSDLLREVPINVFLLCLGHLCDCVFLSV